MLRKGFYLNKSSKGKHVMMINLWIRLLQTNKRAKFYSISRATYSYNKKRKVGSIIKYGE